MGKFSSTFTPKPLSIIEKIEKKREEYSKFLKQLEKDWVKIEEDFVEIKNKYPDLKFSMREKEIGFGDNYINLDSEGFRCIVYGKSGFISKSYEEVINWVIERIVELTKE